MDLPKTPTIDEIIEDWTMEQKYTPIHYDAVKAGVVKKLVDIPEEGSEMCIGVPIFRIGDKVDYTHEGVTKELSISQVLPNGIYYFAFAPQIMMMKKFNVFNDFDLPKNREYNYQVIKRLTIEEEEKVAETGIKINFEEQDV